MATSDLPAHISVRGEAQRAVDADQATIHTTVSATRETKAEASAEVTALAASVVADLAALNGVPLTAHSARAALTWSIHSMHTGEEYGDKGAGAHGPTGRHNASVGIMIAVRDFTLLGQVGTALTARDALAVHSIQWSVDDDNPEWGRLRADAIRAALLKGQDYAAALGGAVIGVEHVADAGLLGGDDHGRIAQRHVAFTASGPSGGLDSTSLDPVPQVLTATIDARLLATVGPLPADA